MPVNETGSKPRLGTGKPLMTRRGRVVVLAAACLVAVTIAFAQRGLTSSREESPSTSTEPQLAAAQPAPAPTTAPRPAARKPAAAAASTRPAASAATTLPVPAKSDMTTVVTAPAPRQDAVSPAEVVTISGCLEQDDEKFQLKDTSGEDAPKGRSWRSGFLRRGNSSVDIIDQANRLHLPTYVGQRVSVTGMMVDKEMQARSVRIVAISCEEKSA
jgi:hypothetical protein